MQDRRAILARIGELDKKIQAIARRHETVRLLMTAPGVGPITATAVVAAFDDAARFRRSSSVGAYLGLIPRRYESGEVSRNGRVSKRGDGFTRKCLYEAANAIFSRKLGGPRHDSASRPHMAASFQKPTLRAYFELDKSWGQCHPVMWNPNGSAARSTMCHNEPAKER